MADSNKNEDWNDHVIQELVSGAQNGCEESQQRLFGQLRTSLAYVANNHIEPEFRAKIGASDIVQQTLTKAVIGLKDYRGKTIAEFKGWLKQIAVNEVRQVKRGFNSDKRRVTREQTIAADSRAASPALQLADSMFTPSSEAIAQEQAAAIHKALEKLKEEHQQVIKLRNWDGLTFAEIAKRMNVTESSAAKLWYRGLIKLQDAFEAETGTDRTV